MQRCPRTARLRSRLTHALGREGTFACDVECPREFVEEVSRRRPSVRPSAQRGTNVSQLMAREHGGRKHVASIASTSGL
jgi:hypothetical protein